MMSMTTLISLTTGLLRSKTRNSHLEWLESEMREKQCAEFGREIDDSNVEFIKKNENMTSRRSHGRVQVNTIYEIKE